MVRHPFMFALITETPLVSNEDLVAMRPALESNAAHCADAWGLRRPVVEVWDSKRKLPHNVYPLVFVDEGGDPGTLAVHYWDPVRGGPGGRVYVHRGSGLNRGRNSWSEAASHEVVEALVDPDLLYWVDHPNPVRAAAGDQLAVEVADFVQDHYEIHVASGAWRVSNFVTPDYFRRELYEGDRLRERFLAEGGKFDRLGTIKKPGQIGPEGYAILRRYNPERARYEVFYESRQGSGSSLGLSMSADQLQAKRHDMARSRRRGAEL